MGMYVTLSDLITVREKAVIALIEEDHINHLLKNAVTQSASDCAFSVHTGAKRFIRHPAQQCVKELANSYSYLVVVMNVFWLLTLLDQIKNYSRLSITQFWHLPWILS